MKQGNLHNLPWTLFILLCCWMASPTSSNTIKCDPKIQYTLRNKTTGEILKCVLVRHCPPGKEPKIPCGTDIDINDVIGQCKTCDHGTYSPTSGPEPCQTCRDANCSDDKIGKGKCSTMQDHSYCACKDGLVMNGDGTGCEAYKQQNTTTKYNSATTKKASPEEPTRERSSTKKPTMGKPSTQKPSNQRQSTQRPSTQQPLTQRPTTGIGVMNFTLFTKITANKTTTSVLSNDRKDNNELQLALIVSLSCVVVIILLAIIFKVYQRCGNRGNTLLQNEEIKKLSQQEEAKESDSTANKLPSLETSEGLRESHPDRSVSADNAICSSPNSGVPMMASYRKLENDDPSVTVKVDLKVELRKTDLHKVH